MSYTYNFWRATQKQCGPPHKMHGIPKQSLYVLSVELWLSYTYADTADAVCKKQKRIMKAGSSCSLVKLNRNASFTM